MKTIVFAYHNIGCIGIRALLKNNFNIAAVFTHVDNPDENLWFESVASLCAEKNIPVYAPEDVNHPIWAEKIQDLAPDIIFSFYYRKLLGEKILAIPRQGCLNLHGSKLPAYRGRCPINWVLVNGETSTGISLHYMTSRPDAGDIVAQADIDISDNDTAYTLHKKSAKALPELMDNVLPLIQANTHPRIPQDTSLSSYFGGRGSRDGEINWKVTPSAVRNLVRAVTKPYPGAFSFAGNRKVLFWDVSVSEERFDAEPGTIVSSCPFVIACDKGAIQVNSGQLESGIHLTGDQLAKDLNLIPGMKFGPRASLKI
ncbi:formyltransferase, partial [Desulfobacula sp.]